MTKTLLIVFFICFAIFLSLIIALNTIFLDPDECHDRPEDICKSKIMCVYIEEDGKQPYCDKLFGSR